MTTDWMAGGKCKEVAPDVFFPNDGMGVLVAQRICAECPVSEACLEYALEVRRRVKEQLKKIGGMEFFDVHFSYVDAETMEEKFISVPEQAAHR